MSDPAGHVELRPVAEDDLPVLYRHQADPAATQMAAFPSRDAAAFTKHWHKILADDSVVARTVLVDGQVAGNVVSFIEGSERDVGYWLGREFWGRGVATAALRLLSARGAGAAAVRAGGGRQRRLAPRAREVRLYAARPQRGRRPGGGRARRAGARARLARLAQLSAVSRTSNVNIMPASRCSAMWQCTIHEPGLLQSSRMSTVLPAGTSTVSFHMMSSVRWPSQSSS